MTDMDSPSVHLLSGESISLRQEVPCCMDFYNDLLWINSNEKYAGIILVPNSRRMPTAKFQLWTVGSFWAIMYKK